MKKRMMLPVLALMLGLMTAGTENTAVPVAPETDRPAETAGTVSGLYGYAEPVPGHHDGRGL